MNKWLIAGIGLITVTTLAQIQDARFKKNPALRADQLASMHASLAKSNKRMAKKWGWLKNY